MARKEYSEETKAAVLAALLAGQSVNAVAKEYNIPKGTISSWAKREEATLGAVRREAARQVAGGEPNGQAGEVGALLLDYLDANLRTLKSQAEVMGEKEYVRDKPIESVALAHGILVDKAVRLIEALNRAESESEPTAS